MAQRDQNFVCGLLVEFADGYQGRNHVLEAGSQANCQRAARALFGQETANGNRSLIAAHVVIVPQSEWDDVYDGPDMSSRAGPSDTPFNMALMASRPSIELMTRRLRHWLPESDAVETAAKAFVRRGTCELVNQIGKDRARAVLRQLLADMPGSPFQGDLDAGRDDDRESL